MLGWSRSASLFCSRAQPRASTGSAGGALVCLVLFTACTQLEDSERGDVDADDDSVTVEDADAQRASEASAEAEQTDARPSEADAGSAAGDAASQVSDAGTHENAFS